MNLLQRIISLNINDNDNSDNINNKNENKEISNFIKDIDEIIKNLQIFNQPIDISNKELYWQRNCYVLYFISYYCIILLHFKIVILELIISYHLKKYLGIKYYQHYFLKM